MAEEVEQELARELVDSTIESIRTDEILGSSKAKDENQVSLNLDSFPMEVLCNIFRCVGQKSFNKAPPSFMGYLKSRNASDYEKKEKVRKGVPFHPNDLLSKRNKWIQKTNAEYAVRNLLLLRRVSKGFEHVIMNEMKPGKDYDWVTIDLKIQGSKKNVPDVTVFKYGGTGALYPATHLKRVRRFNDLPYEHIEKFEKIRNISIINMILNEELFDTLARLDLSDAEKISFERIKDVQFSESINIKMYIQEFMNSLTSAPKVYFNSTNFDPNEVLFDPVTPVLVQQVALQPVQQNMMEVVEEREGRNGGLDDDSSDDENMGWQENVLRQRRQQVLVDGRVPSEDVQRDLRSIERGSKHHKNLRKCRKQVDQETRQFRGFRSLNIVSQVLLSKPQQHDPVHHKRSGRNKCIRKIHKESSFKTRQKSIDLRKCAKWHLKRVFGLLKNKPCKAKQLMMYHLKTVKKISGKGVMLTAEERSIIHQMNDIQQRERLMNYFPFLHKLQLRSRYYVKEVPVTKK